MLGKRHRRWAIIKTSINQYVVSREKFMRCHRKTKWIPDSAELYYLFNTRDSAWCLHHSRAVLAEAVDSHSTRFSRKIQHIGDWEWSRLQCPKNVHNFLMTVRKMSWACDLVAEMLLILKKNIFHLIIRGQNMKVKINAPRFCMGSICGWNPFPSDTRCESKAGII